MLEIFSVIKPIIDQVLIRSPRSGHYAALNKKLDTILHDEGLRQLIGGVDPRLLAEATRVSTTSATTRFNSRFKPLNTTSGSIGAAAFSGAPNPATVAAADKHRLDFIVRQLQEDPSYEFGVDSKIMNVGRGKISSLLGECPAGAGAGSGAAPPPAAAPPASSAGAKRIRPYEAADDAGGAGAGPNSSAAPPAQRRRVDDPGDESNSNLSGGYRRPRKQTRKYRYRNKSKRKSQSQSQSQRKNKNNRKTKNRSYSRKTRRS